MKPDTNRHRYDRAQQVFLSTQAQLNRLRIRRDVLMNKKREVSGDKRRQVEDNLAAIVEEIKVKEAEVLKAKATKDNIEQAIAADNLKLLLTPKDKALHQTPKTK